MPRGVLVSRPGVRERQVGREDGIFRRQRASPLQRRDRLLRRAGIDEGRDGPARRMRAGPSLDVATQKAVATRAKDA
jgi:hypothetical protein